MKPLTKSIAKEKAQTLKTVLSELGHDVGIRHCYEVIAKQNGFESWNSLSGNLKEEPAFHGEMAFDIAEESVFDIVNQVEKDFNSINHIIGEGDKTFEFEVAANAKVKTTFIVKGASVGLAYSVLEEHIKNNEAEVFSGESWEVDGNIGQAQYWDIDLSYSSGLHKTRNLAPIVINPEDESGEEIENEKGISWQSVQQES